MGGGGGGGGGGGRGDLNCLFVAHYVRRSVVDTSAHVPRLALPAAIATCKTLKWERGIGQD